MNTPSSPLLAIRSLRAAYGKIEALKGVDLDINKGEIVALIGANGAGKSTLIGQVDADDDDLRQATRPFRPDSIRRPRHHRRADP
jgi:ABC-type sugar transport system ATPase subunit